MPSIDALPSATSVAATDLVLVGQGAVTGAPGTAITRSTTISDFMAASYPAWIAAFPTSDPGVAGAIWNNGGVLTVSAFGTTFVLDGGVTIG